MRRALTVYTRRHVRIGWWSLLGFLSLGAVLELLHGLKVGWYLDVGNETRRLMWTLAHAHGTLLSLVHIAFGVTLPLCSDRRASWPSIVSPCLFGASILLPGGFFLGGLFIYGGDPGLGIFLLPLGALLLVVAVFLIAWRAVPEGPHPEPSKLKRPASPRAPGNDPRPAQPAQPAQPLSSKPGDSPADDEPEIAGKRKRKQKHRRR